MSHHLHAVPNEPQPFPPYDVENESAPMDEVQTHCPLCGVHWPLWFGQMPKRCPGCGMNPRQERSE